MNGTLVTFLVPISAGRQAHVEQAMQDLGWKVLSPDQLTGTASASTDPSLVRNRVRHDRLSRCMHFFSMVVLPGDRARGDAQSWLLIEACTDEGTGVSASLSGAIPDELCAVLDLCGSADVTPDTLASFLEAHIARMDTKLTARPGLCFAGTPGMTVARIDKEAYLCSRIRQILHDDPLPNSAIGKLNHVRGLVFEEPTLKWALVAEPVARKSARSPSRYWWLALILPAFRDYLWVLLPVPPLIGLSYALFVTRAFDRLFYWVLAALAIDAVVYVSRSLLRKRPRSYGWALPLPVLAAAIAIVLSQSAETAIDASIWAGWALLTQTLLVLLFVGIGWNRIRRDEDCDRPVDEEPGSATMHALLLFENNPGVVQNHLAAQSWMKPGLFRQWALRGALWAVAEVSKARSKPGFLNELGTIHFARWFLLPGGKRFIFLSNYDGSWQSYLEDFIARLHNGVTSLWSNTVGFPKTRGLIHGGASDGARFKRWARRQQLPSKIWFTAYPHLVTTSIRKNAGIRHGLASATTEAEAAAWLSLLGYAPRTVLEENKVPTLVFGRLSALRFATAIVVRLEEGRPAREWLGEWTTEATYGKHVGPAPALVVAFTADGLRDLGLGPEVLRTFPVAFQQGMADPGRARLLGDPAETAACPRPGWGMTGSPVDAVCMAYARTTAERDDLVLRLRKSLEAHGHEVTYECRMAELPDKDDVTHKRATYEAFGFRDNISQPILRGQKGWNLPKNAIHLVQPGEFVLGYPDNQSDDVPSPGIDGVDYGRNGTFLVMRQLTQDRAAFDAFLDEQATRLLRDSLGDELARALGAALDHAPEAGPGRDAALSTVSQGAAPEVAAVREWVAAKMMGRWRSGAPLVRAPAKPGASGGLVNDYLPGKEDPDGVRCPFGSHTRRANPRDSLDPGSDVQLAISNRHRILRVGRGLEEGGGQDAGMLFMCLNADIERQFEFLQQTWLMGPNFHGLDDEVDPILGPGGFDQAMTLTDSNGSVRLEPLKRFVTTVGGGYFFVPGKDCLELLAGARQPGTASESTVSRPVPGDVIPVFDGESGPAALSTSPAEAEPITLQ